MCLQLKLCYPPFPTHTHTYSHLSVLCFLNTPLPLYRATGPVIFQLRPITLVTMGMFQGAASLDENVLS